MPASSRDALGLMRAGAQWLASARTAEMPAGELAECLRGLERVESLLTAARSGVLAAFIAQDACADDGHGSARTWLAWQTKVTRGAAAGAVGWTRRLQAHPDVGEALATGQISGSWARQLCDWTEKLPAEHRQDADVILLGAASRGADLAGLGGLAEEMRRRCAVPDTDDDGFADRCVQLDRTLGGAGRLVGDLTPQCAAALAAVLEALGGKAGPEDTRSAGERDHDALEEACRRLLGAGCLPDRAGQPAQLRLHLTLDQLRSLPGAAAAQAQWAARGLAPAGPGDDCDADIAPHVDGYVDARALDRLTSAWQHSTPSRGEPGAEPAETDGAAGARRLRLQRSLLGLAADALSGPGGLAGYLRTGLLTGPAASKSLPLDLGTPTAVIGPHLRRAVASRDSRCAFPGCDTPPAACQVHHLVPRSEGGVTAVPNLVLLCSFHHLIAIHRWGWQLTLHADGTITARGPDGRILHGTGPPASAA